MKTAYLFVNGDPGRCNAVDFADVVAANLLQQALNFAPAWGLLAPAVAQWPADMAIPADTDVLRSVPVYCRPSGPDDPDGAVAYHWFNPKTGRSECVVLTDVVASLPGAFIDNLSTAAGHECCEENRDEFGAEWQDLPDGNGRAEAFEVCDRVQSASYAITVARADGSKRDVQVTDFLLPQGFSMTPLAPGVRPDFMGRLPSEEPRKVLGDAGDGKGAGYAAIRNADGTEVEVDGDKRNALRYSHGTLKRHGVNVDALRAQLATPKRSTSNMTAGRTGYEAYSAFSGGKSLATGADLPGWEALPGNIREGWEWAATAIRKQFRVEHGMPEHHGK